MVARMLGAAPVLADAVVEQLCRGSDRAEDAHRPIGATSEAEADFLSANVWRSIWPVERYRHHTKPSLHGDVGMPRHCCCFSKSQNQHALPSQSWNSWDAHFPDNPSLADSAIGLTGIDGQG